MSEEMKTQNVETNAPVAPKVETKVEAKAPKVEAKTEAKKPAKTEKKADEKAEVKKETKKKGTKATWVKKAKVTKTDEVKTMMDALSEKWKPVFWGRFGKKNLRKRTNPKFDKWRKPRGIDILLRKDDGALPQAGFRTPKAIRGMHPSGYQEVMVRTKKDLDAMTPAQAARIVATIGRKKKITLITYANEKKIKVLN